jgi:dephospho-CoA kinase
VAVFGRDVVSPTGEIDRKKLGKLVFSNPEARERLNRIMWSRIWEMILERIVKYRAQGFEVVVVEAFGLIEAGWDKLVDHVWVTQVSEKTVIERLKQQRNMDEQEIVARIRSQLSFEERAKHADAIINNESPREEVKAKVKELWDGLKVSEKKQK